MEPIYWDIDEEKQKNKKNAEKILNSFSNIEGLKEVLDDVLSLMDSKIYEKVYKVSELNFSDVSSYIESADELLKMHQIKLASENLSEPPLYMPSFFTDTIIFTHFRGLFELVGAIDYVYAQRKLNHQDSLREQIIIERLMSLLDDFDKSINFQPPDEEFYRKLKKIKWDKQAKKLFGKIRKIRYHIKDVRWGGKSSTFDTTEYFVIILLAACNSVNQGKDKVLPEDVIIAHRTYFKLLNTDITKLM